MLGFPLLPLFRRELVRLEGGEVCCGCLCELQSVRPAALPCTCQRGATGLAEHSRGAAVFRRDLNDHAVLAPAGIDQLDGEAAVQSGHSTAYCVLVVVVIAVRRSRLIVEPPLVSRN